MNIVLHEPGIPQNTGNIGRTCVATHTPLHMIRPYGFKISEKELKRAGMDYWPRLELHEYLDINDFLSVNADSLKSSRLWFATTKARRIYTNVSFAPDDYIMFGNESRGIPEEILVRHPESCIRIPMWGDTRSLNLSNSVAVILYEALRQNGFENMRMRGELHRLNWESADT